MKWKKQSAAKGRGRIQPMISKRKFKKRKEIVIFCLFVYTRPTFSIVSNNFSIDLVRQRLLLSI
jgi:hypothetical protein